MKTMLIENQTVSLILATNKQQSRKFTIQKIIGEGASCIAYRAIDTGNCLPVVLKEFFPSNVAARTNDGAITWNTPADEEKAKERFRKSFEMQRKIQSADEMMNTNVHLIDGLYSGNNTLYSVNAIQNAKTYDAEKDSSLQEIFIPARAIAQAVGQYHKCGLLHLDIKPQNILIMPETREMVRLLDFDSVIQKSDVNLPETIISYSPVYAAPEQLQGRRDKICEATDIYAVGAIVFSKIFEHPPTTDDRSVFSNWNLTENSFLQELSPKTHSLTKELLRKTLSASARGRYQSAAELVLALDELIESAREIPILKNIPLRHTPSFVCRETELNEIKELLAKNNYVILEGIGGIGKTEIAKYFAYNYKTEYDSVQFIRFNGSIKQTIAESLDFHNLNHSSHAGENTENEMYNEKLGVLQNNFTESRCLIVIDSYDVRKDDNFNDLISLDNGLIKFIFTSRVEHEYNALEITEMKDENHLMTLFYEYFGSELPAEAEKTMHDIR